LTKALREARVRERKRHTSKAGGWADKELGLSRRIGLNKGLSDLSWKTQPPLLVTSDKAGYGSRPLHNLPGWVKLRLAAKYVGFSDDDSNLLGKPVVETFKVSNTFAKLG
jgi:hypothetical protein